MIIIEAEGEETRRLPNVSLDLQGRFFYLCTYKVDGEPGLVYHDLHPDEDKFPVRHYLLHLTGEVTDIQFWNPSR